MYIIKMLSYIFFLKVQLLNFYKEKDTLSDSDMKLWAFEFTYFGPLEKRNLFASLDRFAFPAPTWPCKVSGDFRVSPFSAAVLLAQLGEPTKVNDLF